jgi:decaprenylphospho-beta-D-erythro-pentofuranosid-2-ulose 2-reductase
MMERTYRHVVLVGSTSDIGLAILKKLPYSKDAEILLVGREFPELFSIENTRVKIEFHYCDLERFEDLQILASKLSTLLDIDLAIIAAGFLPPENEELNLRQVNKSMMINTVGVINALVVLADRMHSQKQGHILHISSIAAIRPRPRNFTYGASKSSADFFARGLSDRYRNTGLKISVLRPGFVYSKLTKNFKPAPFACEKERLAITTVQLIRRKPRTLYAPRFLRIIAIIIRVLPRCALDRK